MHKEFELSTMDRSQGSAGSKLPVVEVTTTSTSHSEILLESKPTYAGTNSTPSAREPESSNPGKPFGSFDEDQLRSDECSGSKPFQMAIKWNLATLGFYSKLFGVPLAVKDQKVSVDGRVWKRYFWLFNLNLMTIRSVYMFAGLLLSLTVDRFKTPHLAPFYTLFLAAISSANFLAYELLEHDRHMESFAIIWNSILKYQSAVTKISWFKVWFLILLPVSVPAANVLNSTYLAINPQLIIQFRFAVEWALTEGYVQDGLIYKTLVILSTAADYWSLVQNASFFLCIQHMFFLEMWAAASSDLLNRSAASRIGAHQAWQQLSELLVMLRIFNIANSNLLFYLKCTCLSLSIFCISSLLLGTFNDYLEMFLCVAYLAVVCLTFYPVMYGRAYLVAANLEIARSKLPSITSLLREDPSFSRKIRSVQPTGIWVGSFRTYERESTLLYVSFIFDQVVSIILSVK